MKYRSRVVEIEAMEFIGDNLGIVTNWIARGEADLPQRTAESGLPLMGVLDVAQTPEVLTIPTIEGMEKATPGYFIIKGMEGEFYPCKASVFTAKYEEILDR